MSFVARAGHFIDRAHRVAGFLLIYGCIATTLAVCQWQQNVRLNYEVRDCAIRQPVIVVPGAVAGKYDPRQDAELVAAFADFVTQSFNTFTPETLPAQLLAMRPYLAPALLVDSEPYFEKKLQDTSSVKRSALFIPNRSSLTVRNYNQNGVDLRDVELVGTLKNMAAGTLAEDVPLRIKMTFQKGLINPDINPYGFQLVRYLEVPVVRENAPAAIDTSEQPAPPAGQQSGVPQ